MQADLNHNSSPSTVSERSRLIRIWLAAPDWVFRVLGAAFFIGYVAYRAQDYYEDFWKAGAWYEFKSGDALYVPWTRVLVDSTYLLIALGFCFRLPPRDRACRGRDILIALTGAFLPFLPFVLDWTLALLNPDLRKTFQAFMWGVSFPEMLIGTILIFLGNAIDVWGYGTLFRSLSIVPEARELKVTGAYRWIRHPIYLGQMMAQAGVWLFFARFHVVWISFYACFVVLQLYRSKLEDRVLENAFGERYTSWKRKTFWFV